VELERVLRNTPATLTQIFYGDDEPVNADGSVTVTVTSIDGTELYEGTATQPDPVEEPGVYTFPLPAQANLNILNVSWAGVFDGEAATLTNMVEIVGGYYFTVGEARLLEGLEATNVTADVIREKRNTVEVEFEDILGYACVPRYGRTVQRSDGTAVIDMRCSHPIAVTKIKVDGTDVTETYLPLMQLTESGYLIAPDESYWTVDGEAVDVEVCFEHGLTIPDLEIKAAALTRVRSIIGSDRAGIPERATSYVADEGGTYRLAVAGRYGFKTGLPEVDAVLNRKTEKGSGSGAW
jgi:hypothetical protein